MARTRHAFPPDPDHSYRMYIDGEWVGSESGETRLAHNPATGSAIGAVPAGNRADVQRAIDAASDISSDLEFMTEFERAELCRELGAAIEDRQDELAKWLTVDQGKPIDEAAVEVETCAQQFYNAGEDIKRLETDVIPTEDPNKRTYTIRKPHGVVGAITPWNFPLNIPAEYLAPGFAAGNAMVWVPAPSTSVIAVKLLEVFDDTSLPEGAINLVVGEGPVVGDEVVRNDGTHAIGFTGSPETGELISQAAGTKPTLLEMGGNGPVIVLDDANIEAAVEATAGGCFSNAGQICSASERILVHEAVREEFLDRLTAVSDEIALGDPMADRTDMGPLNNRAVKEKMDRHIADAVDKGATVLRGGGTAEDLPTDLYYEPTVIDGVTPDMVVNREESFGPVAPVIPFSDYDEALQITNDIDLGLTSSVFTSNIKSAEYFVQRIQTGIVNVNDSSTYWEIHLPFGGYSGKRSGRGRLGGRHTIEHLSQLKTISIDHENLSGPILGS